MRPILRLAQQAQSCIAARCQPAVIKSWKECKWENCNLILQKRPINTCGSSMIVGGRSPWSSAWFSTNGRRMHTEGGASGQQTKDSGSKADAQSEAAKRAAWHKAREEAKRARNVQIAMYMGGVTLFTVSLTYASVPLYRMFCQHTGFGGTVKTDNVKYEDRAKPVSGKRVIKIKFNADVSQSLPWRFAPQQHSINVVPGEAALAFYTAHNKTSKPIVGVSTYNVQPELAGNYFNKIQCFCFEEQMLQPNEKIDMPVFFFIDPSFLEDRKMDLVETITLSYTFFKVGDSDAPEIAGMLVDSHGVKLGPGQHGGRPAVATA